MKTMTLRLAIVLSVCLSGMHANADGGVGTRSDARYVMAILTAKDVDPATIRIPRPLLPEAVKTSKVELGEILKAKP